MRGATTHKHVTSTLDTGRELRILSSLQIFIFALGDKNVSI